MAFVSTTAKASNSEMMRLELTRRLRVTPHPLRAAHRGPGAAHAETSAHSRVVVRVRLAERREDPASSLLDPTATALLRSSYVSRGALPFICENARSRRTCAMRDGVRARRTA